MASVMIAKTRTTESDTLENRPRCRNRHSSIQAATPVAAMAKRVHTAMSRWELITALEIPGTGGSVSGHIDGLRVTKVGTTNMAQMTKRTRLARVIAALSRTSAVM